MPSFGQFGGMEMETREEIQKQTEETYIAFIKWCKLTLWWIVLSFLVLTMCNFGVEDGKDATGSGYNGEVYAPKGLSDG